jgi:hypothetical protein
MAFSKIIAESMDLTDTYAFTGTVSGAGGVNTPMFHAYNNTGDTVSDATWTKMEFDTEVFDTAGAYDNTNDKFTVPSGQAGKYFFHAKVNTRNTDNTIKRVMIKFYKNGSEVSNKYDHSIVEHTAGNTVGIFRQLHVLNTLVLDLSVGDYIEVYSYLDVGSGTPLFDEVSTFMGYKLIE